MVGRLQRGRLVILVLLVDVRSPIWSYLIIEDDTQALLYLPKRCLAYCSFVALLARTHELELLPEGSLTLLRERCGRC